MSASLFCRVVVCVYEVGVRPCRSAMLCLSGLCYFTCFVNVSCPRNGHRCHEFSHKEDSLLKVLSEGGVIAVGLSFSVGSYGSS